MSPETLKRANHLDGLINTYKTIERWISNKDYYGALGNLENNLVDIPDELVVKIMTYIKDQIILGRLKAEKELKEM